LQTTAAEEMMTYLHTSAFALAALLSLAACDDAARDREAALPGGEAGDATPAAERPSDQIRVADLVGDPQRYVGQTVTVEADVEEVWTPYAFSLDEDAPLDQDLLVFSPKATHLAAIDDQWIDNRARVTGTVRIMSVAELEREIGWDLDPELEAELEDVRPVLIASTVVRANAPQ
jgi:hypothetical protein